MKSQQKAANAWDKGYFAKSIVPVTDQNGVVILDRDEHVRGNTTVESLAGLKPSFQMMGEMGFDGVAREKYHYVEKIVPALSPPRSPAQTPPSCSPALPPPPARRWRKPA